MFKMWRKRKKLIDNLKLEREKIIALDKFNEAFKNNRLYYIYGKGIMDFKNLNLISIIKKIK